MQTQNAAQQSQGNRAISVHEITAHIENLLETNKGDEAEQYLQKILLNHPFNAILLSKLGNVFHHNKKFAAARSCYERAIYMQPENFGTLSNYSNMLQDMGRIKDAVKYSERAYEIAPDSYQVRKNLANKYRDDKQFEKARKLYEELHAENPADANIAFDIGFMSMYLRDLDKGWEFFKNRVNIDFYKEMYESPLPLWDGVSDISDKRLLILSEQGYGDTILLSRFIDSVKSKAAVTGLACDKALHPLFDNLGIQIEDKFACPSDNYDLHIPMMSLPPLFEKDWLKWPATPSISVPEKSKKKVDIVGKHAGKTLKVGIVWSGNPEFKDNARRATTLEPFLELSAKVPLAQFYSFQTNGGERQLKDSGFGTVVRLGHLLDDFGDTAAALEHMDLIIMTDSSLAHLAGSMNVPVINLLHTRPYWIYYPEDNTSALYPTMRFIRQSEPDDWEPVFDKAAEVLSAIDQKKRHRAKGYSFSADNVLKIIDDIL